MKTIIFSGAGLSAESGISTFRDSNGLWENHKIDDVCNERTWKQNFQMVHDFYNARRSQLAEVEPNDAHKAIAEFQKTNDVVIITQNVDDLLERAGCTDVIHVHGELTKMECTACGYIYSIGYDTFNCLEDRCPKCNSRRGVKPHIVFFGGQAPFYKSMYKHFDILDEADTQLIVVGTMGNVVPIANMISSRGHYKKVVKAKTVLCNLEPSQDLPESLFDEVYYDKATIVLPKILNKVEK